MPRNLTKGPILKPLFRLAFPIVLANLFQTTYQLIDTFWVGRLGAEAVAAVSLSFPVIFLLISLGFGMAIAGTVLVAQYKGREQEKNINYVAGQTFLMMLLAAVIVTTVGYFLSPHVIDLMNIEESVFADAVAYLQISFLGIIFLFIFFVFQSLMRGVGDVKTPLYIVMTTVFLNLFLDPLFIFGWGPFPALGVAGAALATIFTEGLAAATGLLILFSGKYGIHLNINRLKPDFRLIQKIFRLGLPASIEHSARASGMLVMAFLVSTFDTVVIASYGIGARILTLVIIPSLGLSMANSTLVGQNMGAGKISRAERTSRIALVISFAAFTFIGLIVFLLAEQIAGFFIPEDAAVISTSVSYLRIMALFFGFIGLQQIVSSTFRGSGNTLVAMALSVVALWVLRLPLAYFLSNYTSLSYNGIWWSFPLTNVAAGIIALIWFWRGSWKKKKIIEEFKLVEEKVEEKTEEALPYN